MQCEDAVQRAHQNRVGFVFFAWRCKHHVHEVGGIAQIIAREVERQTVGVTVAHGGDGGDFGDEAVNGDFAVFRVGNFQAVLIESGQCADYADHHRHRVRIAAETAEEPCQLFVHHSVFGHGIDKLFFLCGIGQFAVNQQVAHFQIVAFFCQLFNGIAAIVQ